MYSWIINDNFILFPHSEGQNIIAPLAVREQNEIIFSFCSLAVRDVMGILSLTMREQNEILSLTMRYGMRF